MKGEGMFQDTVEPSGYKVGSTMWIIPRESVTGVSGDGWGEAQTSDSTLKMWRGDDFCYHWPYTWPITETKKIRLKLSEVETLRKAVNGNPEARKILNKLAPCIEIEVDF